MEVYYRVGNSLLGVLIAAWLIMAIVLIVNMEVKHSPQIEDLPLVTSQSLKLISTKKKEEKKSLKLIYLACYWCPRSMISGMIGLFRVLVYMEMENQLSDDTFQGPQSS